MTATPPPTAVEERGHNYVGGQEQVKKQTAGMRDVLEGHVVEPAAPELQHQRMCLLGSKSQEELLVHNRITHPLGGIFLSLGV